MGDSSEIDKGRRNLLVATAGAGGVAVVGTAVQVKTRLDELAKRLDLDELVIVTWTYDVAPRMRSYELLAQAYGLK